MSKANTLMQAWMEGFIKSAQDEFGLDDEQTKALYKTATAAMLGDNAYFQQGYNQEMEKQGGWFGIGKSIENAAKAGAEPGVLKSFTNLFGALKRGVKAHPNLTGMGLGAGFYAVPKAIDWGTEKYMESNMSPINREIHNLANEAPYIDRDVLLQRLNEVLQRQFRGYEHMIRSFNPSYINGRNRWNGRYGNYGRYAYRGPALFNSFS